MMTPLQALAKSQEIHRRLESLRVSWHRKMKQAHRNEIKCRKGCSHCCRLLVLSWTFEGILIAHRMIRSGSASLDTFRRLQAVSIEQMPKLHEIRSRDRGAVGADQVDFLAKPDSLANEWFERYEPCPLLKDGQCSVYDVRPLACSSHYVVSPVEHCDLPVGQEVATLNNMELQVRAFHFNAELFSSILGQPLTAAAPEPLATTVLGGVVLLTKGVEEFCKLMNGNPEQSEER